jgi:hypothetical protein
VPLLILGLQNHVFTLHEYVKEAGEVRDPYGGTKEMYVHTSLCEYDIVKIISAFKSASVNCCDKVVSAK